MSIYIKQFDHYLYSDTMFLDTGGFLRFSIVLNPNDMVIGELSINDTFTLFCSVDDMNYYIVKKRI